MIPAVLPALVWTGTTLALLAGTPAPQALRSPSLACPVVHDMRPLLEPGTVLLLGEIHGSREAPAFAAAAACLALERGRDVVLALEIPREERSRVRSYLASAGGASARRELVDGPFWKRANQDGRSSRAMADLIERARVLQRETGRLEVRLFDREEIVPSQVRDRRMARDLVEIVTDARDAITVALTGNTHARTTVGTRWDADFEPMGSLLLRALPDRRILSLNLEHPDGTAWVCTGPDPTDCGERPMRGVGEPVESPRVRLHGEPGAPYDGTYALPSLSASPPANPEGAATTPSR